MGPTYRFNQKKYSRNSEKLNVTKGKKFKGVIITYKNARLKELMKKKVGNQTLIR